MLPQDWTPHRRDDGELLGWIAPRASDWIAIDLLGRVRSEPGDWLEAERVLEDAGLAWLAERWWLDGEPVRIAEVTTERIVLVADDFGAAFDMSTPARRQVVPWPAPPGLTQEAPMPAASDREERS